MHAVHLCRGVQHVSLGQYHCAFRKVYRHCFHTFKFVFLTADKIFISSLSFQLPISACVTLKPGHLLKHMLEQVHIRHNNESTVSRQHGPQLASESQPGSHNRLSVGSLCKGQSHAHTSSLFLFAKDLPAVLLVLSPNAC